jgi:DNA-binding response OmpR family regulator
MSRARRILLVDDDPAIRASLSFALGLEGFEVDTFESGEALTSREPHIDDVCLVLDYRLPQVDGVSLLKQLRSRGTQLPAVIITSNPSRAVRRAIAEAGAALIEKPLLCDALSQSIKSLIERGSGHDTPSSKEGGASPSRAEDSRKG